MENEQINPKTQIIIDEDVSLEKLNFLIKLGIEEERLDFKETLDFSDNSRSKKSKIDLTCDITAISNTDGGYIIIGIKEVTKGQFQVEGANEDCLRQITQENVINILGNYIDDFPKLVIRAHELNGFKLIIVYVGKSKILVPFKQDGQFGNNERKFNSGDIFVRHGAITTKANYGDIRRFVENIKSEERKVLNIEGKGTAQIINRLDKLIEVFTGTTPSLNDFNILENSLEAIEDYIFNLSLDKKNIPIIKRVISRYFQKIKLEIDELEQISNDNELIEKIRLVVPSLLEKLIPIWNSLNEHENFPLTFKLSDDIYELWELTFRLQGRFSKIVGPNVILQAEIIKLVYIFIAIAIKNNNSFKDRPA